MFKACKGQVCSLKIPSVRVQHQRVLIKRMRNARLFWQLLSCRVWGQQQLLRLLQLFIWSLSACLLDKLFCVRLRVQLLVLLLLRLLLLLLLLALSESRAHIAWEAGCPGLADISQCVGACEGHAYLERSAQSTTDTWTP